jgi:NitT/TauT family transport system substrate-binding protein
MIRWRITKILITTIIGLLLISCSGAAQGQSDTSSPITFAWTFRGGDYTLLIAQELGLFANHGIEVEPVLYNTTSRAIPDIAGAKLDGGLLNIGELILGTSVVDIKGVMVSDSGPVYSVVSSPDISSVTELNEKRVGVNLHTSSGMFVSYMLEKAMLTSRQVQLIEMSPEEVVQGIPDLIDAGLVWEPYTTQALQRGDNLLFRSDIYSTLIPSLIVFRTTIIERRPDDIRAFLQAWDEAVEYRIAHPQEALELISQATGISTNELKIDEGETLFNIEDNLNIFSDTSGTDAASIYHIAEINLNYIISLGDITRPPDLTTMLDPSFLEEEK